MQLNLNLLIATAVLVTTVNSRAALGWTLEETIAHYGQPLAEIPTGDATKDYFFENVDGHDGSHYKMDVFFFQGEVCYVAYFRYDSNDQGIDFPES
jgi:hypothetical protein